MKSFEQEAARLSTMDFQQRFTVLAETWPKLRPDCQILLAIAAEYLVGPQAEEPNQCATADNG